MWPLHILDWEKSSSSASSLSLSRLLTSVCLSIRIRALEKTLVQLQSETSEVRAKALEEQKKRENQDALVRRLQKRVLLLTKVWRVCTSSSGLINAPLNQSTPRHSTTQTCYSGMIDRCVDVLRPPPPPSSQLKLNWCKCSFSCFFLNMIRCGVRH